MKFPGSDLLRNLFRGSPKSPEDDVTPEPPESATVETPLPPTIPVESAEEPPPTTRAAARALAQAKALAASSPSILDDVDDTTGTSSDPANVKRPEENDPRSGPVSSSDSANTMPVRRPNTGPNDQSKALRPVVTRAQKVGAAAATWRAELVELAGSSPLVDTALLGDAQIDITHAHPSGQAQLYAGRTTRLSNLVRESGQLSTARKRASRVQNAAEDLGQRFGISPAYLAIGIATWAGPRGSEANQEEIEQFSQIQSMTFDPASPSPGANSLDALLSSQRARDTGASPRSGRILRNPQSPRWDTRAESAERSETPPAALVRAPVLLRPVRLVPRDATGSDYDLTLEDSLEINPVLLRALQEYGAPIDARALTQGSFTGNGFNPGPALERLRELGTEALARFEISDSLLIGTFVNPGQSLVDDLDEHTEALERHELIAAIAGDQDAISALQVTLPEPRDGDVDPAQDVGIGDLEPDQIQIVRAAATGAHLLLDAPPGADCAGTVAALIGDAVSRGRNVLYVSAHRRSADALLNTMRDLGATDLVLDTYPTPGQGRDPVVRSLLAGLTASGGPPRIDHTTDPAVRHAGLRAELVELRSLLNGYVKALHTPRFPWHVSAYQALQALARLTSTQPAPHTTVRLNAETVRLLDADRRAQMCVALEQVWDLGAFDDATSRTAWFGAAIDSRVGADRALALVDELHDTHIPAILDRIDTVANHSGVWAARSMNQWEAQLRMFDGVRQTLDILTPVVFERSAKDLVAATATKEWRAERGIEMSGRMRRRFKKQAEDLVRPGTTVDDLHSRLLEAQVRREQWEKFSAVGGWPRLPEDLADAEHEFEKLATELDELTQLLSSIEGAADLREMPFDQISIRLVELRHDSAAMETLPDRTRLLSELDNAGLAELVEDLRVRQVERELVAKELELSWWSSLFESIVTEVPELAGYDGESLATLTDRYREVDLAHIETLVEVPIIVADQRRRAAVHGRRDAAESFFAELVDGRLVSLRDVVMRYAEVARSIRPCWVASPMLVPQTAEPGRTTDLLILDVEQDLPASQAIPAIARAKQVVVLADPRRSRGGIVGDLAGILPALPIRASRTRRDPRLTMFLGEHGYGDALVPVPLPDSEGLIQLTLVNGMGMPSPGGDTVESVRAEVEATVDLVLDHAMTRPDESLAVVTISPLHAVNVRDAVYAEVRKNPTIAEFFAVDRPMPFTVVDALSCGGLQRDAIILSLGYAKTPHGRVLHRFGPVSEQYGDHILRAALATTEHRLTIVSCIAAEDLDPDRMRAAGPKMLLDLLKLAEASRYPEAEAALTMPDPLLVDLAERVWRLGIDVVPNVAFSGGPRIPLAVGHPDLPDRLLLAVLTDDDAYVGEKSLRIRDRQAVERLTRRGWAVMHEWASSVFLDPQAEADAVVAAAEAGRERIFADPAAYGVRLRTPTTTVRERIRARNAPRPVAKVPEIIEVPADEVLPAVEVSPPVAVEVSVLPPPTPTAIRDGATPTVASPPAEPASKVSVSTATVSPGTISPVSAPQATEPAPAPQAAATPVAVPPPAVPLVETPATIVPPAVSPLAGSPVPSSVASLDEAEVSTQTLGSSPGQASAPERPRKLDAVSDAPSDRGPSADLQTASPQASGASTIGVADLPEASGAPNTDASGTSPGAPEVRAHPDVSAAAQARLEELALPLTGQIPAIEDNDLADGSWSSVMGPMPSRSEVRKRRAARRENAEAQTESLLDPELAAALDRGEAPGSVPTRVEPPTPSKPVRESVLSLGRGGKPESDDVGSGEVSPETPTVDDPKAGVDSNLSSKAAVSDPKLAADPESSAKPEPDFAVTDSELVAATEDSQSSKKKRRIVVEPDAATPVIHLASEVVAEHDRYLPELDYDNEDDIPDRLEPRPMVVAGLPISAYSDDQLDDLVGWISSDGAPRTAEELAAAVRDELGVVRRNARIDAVIAIAVQRRG